MGVLVDRVVAVQVGGAMATVITGSDDSDPILLISATATTATPISKKKSIKMTTVWPLVIRPRQLYPGLCRAGS